MGVDVQLRGHIIEEQIEVLRLLWSKEIVTFHGQFHTFNEAGLNPLPVRRSIPIWTGGQAEVLLCRTARIAELPTTLRLVPVDVAIPQTEVQDRPYLYLYRPLYPTVKKHLRA